MGCSLTSIIVSINPEDRGLDVACMHHVETRVPLNFWLSSTLTRICYVMSCHISCVFIVLSTVQGQGGHSSSIPFCYIAMSKSAQREAVAILFLPKKECAKEDLMYLAGFHTEGAGIPPPLPPATIFPPVTISSPLEILKLSMVINVLSQLLNNSLVPDCVRSNLRWSKFKISWGSMPPDPPSRHTLLSSCYHHVPSPPPIPPTLRR